MKKAILAAVFLFVFGVMTAFGQDEDLRVKGFWQYQHGKYAEAVETFRESLKKLPSDGFTLRYLAASLENLGKRDEAIKAFVEPFAEKGTEAVKLDKDLKIKSKARPYAAQEAAGRGAVGTVMLMVEFRHDGKVGFVVPIITMPNGLTEKFVEAAKKTKFNPAHADGKPASVVRMMTYSINIFVQRI